MSTVSQSPLSIPADRVDRTALFAAAASESRRVRWPRILLPLSAAVLTLVVIGASVASRIEIAFSVGDLKITVAGLAMDAPRLTGSDGKGRVYVVTTKQATQSLNNTQQINFTGIDAHVTQPDSSTTDLTASAGIYDSDTQLLTLNENVHIAGSDGTAGRLKQAVINLGDGSVSSDGPVAFSSNLGEIEAQGMGMTRKTGTVTFDGGVKMTVDPATVQTSPSPAGDPTPAEQRP